MSVFAYVSWCGYVIMVLMSMSVYIVACVTGICVVFICACSSECKWVTIFFPWWLWTQLGECGLLRQDKGG